jgi:hypothetical protein
MTQKLSLENEQIKQDEDDNKIIEQQTPKTVEVINDNNLLLDNSLQTSQPKEQQLIRKSKIL